MHQPDMYLALSAYLGVTPNRYFLNSESFYRLFLKFGSNELKTKQLQAINPY